VHLSPSTDEGATAEPAIAPICSRPLAQTVANASTGMSSALVSPA